MAAELGGVIGIPLYGSNDSAGERHHPFNRRAAWPAG